MLLISRFLIALLLAGGSMSLLVQGASARPGSVAVASDIGAACEPAADATSEEVRFFGFCLNDCSWCASSADCGGAPCTEICTSGAAPTR